MKTIRFENHGGYEELAPADVPVPEPGEGEVLLRMSAAVNPLDDTMRLGRFPAAMRPPLVPGIEGVGVVVEPGASSLAEGARVMLRGAYGVARDGTWREYVAADAGDLVPAPDPLSDEAAAGVPVAWLTAHWP